jgi:uncharacterized short protein YbdD (DUF466 family)
MPANRRGMSAGADPLARIAAVFRTIAGMPDYEAHVAHLQHHHPETPLPSRRDFYQQFLEYRYQDGPTRCC